MVLCTYVHVMCMMYMYKQLHIVMLALVSYHESNTVATTVLCNHQNEDDSLQPSEQQMLETLRLCILQSNQDPAGLTALLEDWFTIEDREIVKLDEVEIILDATTDDQEPQNDAASPTPGSEDLESDADDCLEQSAEPSCEQSQRCSGQYQH